MKTYSETRIELRSLQFFEENAGKVESVSVVRSAQSAEKFGCCLEYCRSWQIRSENLQLWSTWRPFESSLKRKGALVKVEICGVYGWWFSNQFEIVSETPFSCDTVGLACEYSRLSFALATTCETRRPTSKTEVVFWMFRIPNINQCVKNFLRLRKVEFTNWINLINVLFIGFVKQWFSAI